MKKLTVLLLFSALVYANSLQAQTIEKAVVADTVVNLEAVNVKPTFKLNERAYCWMRVANATVGSQVKVNWYLEGELQHTSTLEMKYESMRTYTYKTLRKAGNWKAEIVDSTDHVIKILPFRCVNG